MKRLVVLVVLAFATVGAFAAVAANATLPPIGKDHVHVSASFDCAADGTQTITWLMQNFTHNTSMSISLWVTTPDTSTPISTVVGPQGSTTATATVTPGTAVEHATVTAHWPTDREDHQTIDADVPVCTPDTTVPTTAPPTTAGAPVGGQGSTVAPSTSSPAELPFTGSSATGPLVAFGIALAGMGGLFVGLARRRRTS